MKLILDMENLDKDKRNELLDEIVRSKYNDSTNWSYVKYLTGKLILHTYKGTKIKLIEFYKFIKKKVNEYK